MTDLTALPALLARVEAATGPDRALDSSLWAALGDRVGGTSDLDAWLRGDPIPPAEPVMGLTIAEALDRGVYGIAEAWRVPRFTTSLDAAVALVEKLRPGTFITVWARGRPGVIMGHGKQ